MNEVMQHKIKTWSSSSKRKRLLNKRGRTSKETFSFVDYTRCKPVIKQMGFRRRTCTANKISVGDGYAHSKRVSIAKSLSRRKKKSKKSAA